MDEQELFTQLFEQYQTLCQYCDEVFTATFQAFRNHMQCAQGCASCCLLETIAPLEAFVIASYVYSSAFLSESFSTELPLSQTGCVFLHHNECAIYPVRPIICRTHGLPLLYPDRDAVDVCPLNFTGYDLSSLPPEFVLDANVITDNLMRLNLAFCMLAQNVDTAGDRIPLSWLMTEQYENYCTNTYRMLPVLYE